MKPILYHDGCDVCTDIERMVLSLINVENIEVMNISHARGTRKLAIAFGVKAFPAIVTGSGNVLHLNVMEHEGSIDFLLN